VTFLGPHVTDPLVPWTYSPTGETRSLCPLCDWFYDWPSPRIVIRPGQTLTEACDESFGQQHAETRAAVQGHMDEHAAEVAARED
jgi:hypothetical protein